MLSSHTVASSAKGWYAQKLMSDLMENYSNALRPVEDTDKPLNVTLQITLSQIKDMVSQCNPACSWLRFLFLYYFLTICLFVYFSVSVLLYLCDKTIQK